MLNSLSFATLAPDLLSKSCVWCSAGEHPCVWDGGGKATLPGLCLIKTKDPHPALSQREREEVVPTKNHQSRGEVAFEIKVATLVNSLSQLVLP